MCSALRPAALIASLLAMAVLPGIASAAPPPNDNFASATVYPKPGELVGSNVDATRETGEPSNGDATVWWKWTPTESGRYRLDDCATVPALSTVLGVYTGDSVSSLTEVTRNTNESNCDNSDLETLAFDAVAGAVYRFSVGSYFSPRSSNIRLNLRRTELNDNFESAFAFDPAPGTVTGTNNEATREDGEPNNGERTVWWKWTAPDSAEYSLDTCQTDPAFSSVVGVYVGEAVSSLQQIPTQVGTCPSGTSGSGVFFNAVAGTAYHFSVGSYSSSASANIRLRLQRSATPACTKATADLANANVAASKARKGTARAKAAVKRANRSLKKARGRRAKARARGKVKSAKRKLKSARAKQRKANAALVEATAAQQAQC